MDIKNVERKIKQMTETGDTKSEAYRLAHSDLKYFEKRVRNQNRDAARITGQQPEGFEAKYLERDHLRAEDIEISFGVGVVADASEAVEAEKLLSANGSGVAAVCEVMRNNMEAVNGVTEVAAADASYATGQKLVKLGWQTWNKGRFEDRDVAVAKLLTRGNSKEDKAKIAEEIALLQTISE